jgi:hypothetical protein
LRTDLSYAQDEPGILSCFSNQWLQLSALGYARSDYEGPSDAEQPLSLGAPSPSIATGRLKTPRSGGLTPRGDLPQGSLHQPTTSRSSRRSTGASSSTTQRTRFRDPPLLLQESGSRTSSRGGLRIEMHSPRGKGGGLGPSTALRKVWSNVTSAKALFLVRAPL